jgi:hypothetical protein
VVNINFSGLHNGEVVPPQSAYQHNLQLVAQQSAFNGTLDQILEIDPVTKKYVRLPAEIIPLLDDAYAKFDMESGGLSAQQLMRFFNAFMNIKAHDRMISLFEKSKDTRFQNAPIVIERVAVAYNMLQQPMKTIAWVQHYLQDAQVTANGLSLAEMYGALGKAYSIQQLKAEALARDRNDGDAIASYRHAFGLAADAPLPSNSELHIQTTRALAQSGEAYEKGFMDGFAYYPGINAVYSEIARGDIEQAKANAELVYLATLRDGGLESSDYWTVATMVEALLIMGKGHEGSFKAALDRVAQIITKTPEWRFESTFGKWNTVVRPALEKLASTEEHGAYAGQALQRAAEAEIYLTAVYQNPSSQAADRAKTRSPGEQFLSKSHGYRGMSVFDVEMVTNNFAFGGLISHVLVNRCDKHEFRKLLSMPAGELVRFLGGESTSLDPYVNKAKSLFDISDPNVFIDAAQVIIRQNFGTVEKKMEIIDNPDRFQAFDQTTKALDLVAGAPEGKAARNQLSFDFKTSVAAEFAKGLGDCRHHAQALQIMFDVWQEHKLSVYLRLAHDTTGGRRDAAIRAFQELEQVRLRTIDVKVYAPVRMKETYRPERPPNDPHGYIADSENRCVENHTMNMLFRVGEHGRIEDPRIRCAFYQEAYPWRDQAIDSFSIRIKKEENGKIAFELDAGDLRNVQDAPQNKVPVRLVSDGYSGERVADARDDPGAIYERGHICEGFDIVKLLENRAVTVAQLEAIRQFVENHTSAPQRVPLRQSAKAILS